AHALPMIGPVTTAVGLTRAGADVPQADVAKLYPGGRRTFARLLPDEAAQGAGAALEAKRLGAHRVYVLSDGGYGVQMAASFARAARAYGGRASLRGAVRGDTAERTRRRGGGLRCAGDYGHARGDRRVRRHSLLDRLAPAAHPAGRRSDRRRSVRPAR